ncbi:MAG TPA: ATP-binding protein [bacterium]|nr:ATP-binding protein [bacterium]
MAEKKGFKFEISLSVLDHLGRHLYRSFATVLGEAISNSWDADAKNVWIFIDREKNSFLIKDDGVGMSEADFQNKFLKVGYTKRKDGNFTSPGKRKFIGRKGIGKLALLSCAERVHLISKTIDSGYVGGIIDNSGLDKAITNDMAPQEYDLGEVNASIFDRFIKGHEKGTIIYFENIKDGIRNSLDFLRKIIALYFRFSLLDTTFNIFIDGEVISIKDLNDLAQKTEFVWNVNGLKDPYIEGMLTSLKESMKNLSMAINSRGFVASVSKPRDLKVIGTDERASVDLFVNGRIRERDILKHIPTARIAENYFYGQFHFDELDDEVERFTTSREGIIAEDPKYQKFLEELRSKILEINDDWDRWRIKHRKPGDSESERITQKERAAGDLFSATSGDYVFSEGAGNKERIEKWVDELRADALFNFESYADCFISENLVREYIRYKNISLESVRRKIDEFRRLERIHKEAGNLNIDIRKNDDDLNYLDMTQLSERVDDAGIVNTIVRDSKEYKPIRDAVAHTSLITDVAKTKLTTIFENIKGRIRIFLNTE